MVHPRLVPIHQMIQQQQQDRCGLPHVQQGVEGKPAKQQDQQQQHGKKQQRRQQQQQREAGPVQQQQQHQQIPDKVVTLGGLASIQIVNFIWDDLLPYLVSYLVDDDWGPSPACHCEVVWQSGDPTEAGSVSRSFEASSAAGYMEGVLAGLMGYYLLMPSEAAMKQLMQHQLGKGSGALRTPMNTSRT